MSIRNRTKTVGKTRGELMLEEHARRITWRIRRNLFLMACAGAGAGSLLYLAFFK